MPETAPAIARIRRFNRAVTVEAGALDASYLGRGRPLGVARVLCTIGADGCEVKALRDALGLDSGLASRILRALEEEGLIELAADPADRRRRLARATEAGLREIAGYERLSDRRAAAILAALGPAPEPLLAAMDRIATVLNRERIAVEEADPAAAEAKDCLARYYAELAARFPAGFDPGPGGDEAEMRPPRGAFLLARSDGRALGCVALRTDAPGTGEVKRLWIAPEARGLGLATRLMRAIEDRARTLGLPVLRLDTNGALTEAVALYRRHGWTEIGRYNDNPYAQHWFEKRLEVTSPA